MADRYIVTTGPLDTPQVVDTESKGALIAVCPCREAAEFIAQACNLAHEMTLRQQEQALYAMPVAGRA